MNNGPISDYPFALAIPEGDNRERQVCAECGWINYVNPKIVAGAVVTAGDKFLICKRAIEPRSGYWTMPAGYLEEGEAPAQGAKREAVEEANAEIAIDALLGIYAVARISQVHMIFRATLTSPEISPGEESSDVALVAWDDIPWDELAFPTVSWALNHFRDVAGRDDFQPFMNLDGEMWGFQERRVRL